MTISRIYQPISLAREQTIVLDEDASHHLRVLRPTLGTSVIVFNGMGEEYQAELIQLTQRAATLRLIEPMTRAVESPLQIHLGQAVSRGDKMDLVIQKAVELGVSQITPLLTERCGVHLSKDRWEKRLERWQAIIISACEQSGRTRLPLLSTPQTLVDWLSAKHLGLRLVLHPHATQRLASFTTSPTTISLLIGPEGGFSPQEITAAQQHQFQPLQLGPRTLRTETAPLAALTALQCRWGDM